MIYRDTTGVGNKKNLSGVANNEFQSKVTYRGKKTMKIFEILRKSVFVLMLSFMVTAILPACSSSEEEAPAESSSSGCGDPDLCAPEDLQCREEAVKDCNF